VCYRADRLPAKMVSLCQTVKQYLPERYECYNRIVSRSGMLTVDEACRDGDQE